MIFKEILLGLVFLAGVSLSQGQVRLEAQLGGSNFLGLTINSVYDIPLTETGDQCIETSLGMGFLAPGWDVPTVILHGGLNYMYRHWGAGAEVSGFTSNPFWGNKEESRDFPDVIVYPNVNYTFYMKSRWYFKLSGGVLFAFSRPDYDGDPLPAGGLSAGYIF
jgi:hypothetical protein